MNTRRTHQGIPPIRKFADLERPPGAATTLQRAWALLISALMLFYPATGFASVLPTGGTVIHGDVEIGSEGALMNINQATHSAIVDWQSFNIGTDASVIVNQPDSSAAMLSRVVGGDPSAILGSLEANGIFYLVNPRGIIFGQDAMVDVGALVASTLDITDSDFLGGRNIFSGDSEYGITNYGIIKASDFVVLLAQHIKNYGAIQAPGGTAALAARDASMQIDKAYGGTISIDVSGIAAGAGQIDNTGYIDIAGTDNGVPDGGSAILEGDRIVHSGEIRADGASSGGHGGLISLLAGDSLSIEAGSSLSAAGEGGAIGAVAGGDLSVADGASLVAGGDINLEAGGALEISPGSEIVAGGNLLLVGVAVEGDGSESGEDAAGDESADDAVGDESGETETESESGEEVAAGDESGEDAAGDESEAADAAEETGDGEAVAADGESTDASAEETTEEDAIADSSEDTSDTSDADDAAAVADADAAEVADDTSGAGSGATEVADDASEEAGDATEVADETSEASSNSETTDAEVIAEADEASDGEAVAEASGSAGESSDASEEAGDATETETDEVVAGSDQEESTIDSPADTSETSEGAASDAEVIADAADSSSGSPEDPSSPDSSGAAGESDPAFPDAGAAGDKSGKGSGSQTVTIGTLPSNPTVLSGLVDVTASASTMTVNQTTNAAVVEWETFSIGLENAVFVEQPSAVSALLSRIVGTDPSEILGTLEVTGYLYLINPRGIIFGEDAVVDAAGLVASTLDMTDNDFLDGKIVFSGNSANAITNRGALRTEELIALIANDVENAGSLEAPGGAVGLAAHDTTLDLGAISIDIEGLVAGDAINSGSIDVSGNSGGAVLLEGNRVGQWGNVSADGTTGGGGTIDIFADEIAALGSESVSQANAGTAGDGGTVIVYSPNITLFRTHAVIEARGGSESGDGGFIEVSGREYIEVYGNIDARAPSGAGESGTFLIDPSNITVTTKDEDTAQSGGDPNTFAYSATASDDGESQILNTTLDTAIFGANVIIDTTPQGTFNAAGNITISSAVAPAGTNYLALRADADVTISADITLGGDLYILAGRTTAAGTITQTAGTIQADDVVAVADDGITLNTLSGVTNIEATLGGTGDIAISNTGSIVVGGITIPASLTGVGFPATVTGVNSNNGNINITAASTLTITESVSAGTGGDITLTADDMAINTAVTSAGGALVLQPNTPSLDIDLGGTLIPGLQLSPTEVGSTRLTDGFSSITIGRDDGTGTMTINNNISMADDVVLRMGGDGGRIKSFPTGNTFQTTTSGDTITVTAGSGTDFTSGNNTFELNTGYTLKTDNGVITINANDVVTSTSSFVDSGSANLIIQPRSNAQEVKLGGSGGLNLSDAELDRFFTTGALVIGNTSLTTGISIEANGINAGSATALHLKSGSGGIVDTSGLSQSSLAITSVGSVTLDGSNDIDTLAVLITGEDEGFEFTDASEFTVGTVDGISGITTEDGNVTLNVLASTINLEQDISTGSGIIAGSGATTVNISATTAEINDGIDLVQSGGTVSIAKGSFSQNVVIDKALTLAGATGTASDVNIDHSIGVGILVDFNGSVAIEDLTVDGQDSAETGIKLANTGSGFGSSSAGGTTNFSNVVVEQNERGVFVGTGETAVIEDSTIKSNTLTSTIDSSTNGAGILNTGDLTLRNSTVDSNDNTVGRGGGIHSSTGSLTITSSTISNNQASNGGAVGQGGGIFVASGSADLTNATIAENSALITGGSGGGGIFVSGGTVTLTHSTVADNEADNDSGGGIVRTGGTVTLTNTLVADNNASSAKDLEGDFLGSGNNVVESSPGVGPDYTLTGTPATGVAIADAALMLADNGGPTQTIEPDSTDGGVSGNVIEGDDNTAASSAGVTVDQRGVPRPIGTNVDVGAVEVSANTQTLAGGPVTLEFDGFDFLLDGVPITISGSDPIVILGDTGDDAFTLDFSMGDPTNGVGIVFLAGAGGNDSLTITGSPAFTTGTYTFDNENDGSIDFDGLGITYTGLEPITDNGIVANRIFTFTSALDETITLDDTGASDNMINSSIGGESVDFLNPTTSLTINATGGGVDTINWDSLDAAFTASVTITATGDDDFVVISDGLPTLDDLSVTAASITFGDAGDASFALTTDTSGQTYTGAVTLAKNSTLTATTGGVSFSGGGSDIIGGAFNLFVDAAGAANFGGDVGMTTAVTEFAVDADTVSFGSTSNDVDILGANVSGTGNFSFTDTDGLDVGTTVAGPDGVTTNDGSISITVPTGTSTLTVSKAITAGGGGATDRITLTAMDVAITAAVSAAATDVTLNAGANTVGIGDGATATAQTFKVSGAELQLITTGDDLFVNTSNATASAIIVDDVADSDDANVTDVVDLNATAGGIDFSGTASTFRDLNAQASSGPIDVTVPLIVDEDDLTLNASAALNVTGGGTLATTFGAGARVAVTAGTTFTSDGTGTVTSADRVTITAADVAIGAAVTSANNQGVFLNAGANTVGLGDGATAKAQTFSLESSELQKFNTAGFGDLVVTTSDATASAIVVDAVADGDDANVADRVDLNATAGGILFQGAASTFKELDAQANGAAGIDIQAALTADVANIILRGDLFDLAAAVTSSSGDIDLKGFTTTKTLGLNSSGADINFPTAALSNLSATSGTVTIGDNAGGDGLEAAIFVGADGAVNLSGTDYNLELAGETAAASVAFSDSLTLANDKVLTIRSSLGAVTSPGVTTDVIIGGTTGRLAIVGAASVGVSGTPLTTNVDRLTFTGLGGDLFVQETDALAITGANSSTGGNTVDLNVGGDLTQGNRITGGGTLVVTSSGDVTLTQNANEVDTFRATLSTLGKALQYTDADDLILEGTSPAIQTIDGDITVITRLGNLTVTNDTGGADDITSGTGKITLTAGSQVAGGDDSTATSTLTIGAGAKVDSNAAASDAITLNAQNMTITGLVDASGDTAGGVTIGPNISGTTFELGAGVTDADGDPDTLAIDNTEYGNISVGATGGVTFPSNIGTFTTPALGFTFGANDFSLTADTIIDGNAGVVDFTGTGDLTLSASNGIGTKIDPIETNVDVLTLINDTSLGAFVVNTENTKTVQITAQNVVGGGYFVSSTPQLISGANVVAGNFAYRATADGGNDDDLTLDTGATISHSGGGTTLLLQAGDNIILNGGTSSITTTEILGLIADYDNSNDGGFGSITQNAGNSISAGSLRLSAHEAISVTKGTNTATTLAGDSDTSTFSFSDNSGFGAFTVDSVTTEHVVDGTSTVNGITATMGLVTVNLQDGDFTVSEGISGFGVTIDQDTNNNDGGDDFIVEDEVTISSLGQTMNITTSNINLQDNDAGTDVFNLDTDDGGGTVGDLNITASTTTRQIGLGASGAQLRISSSELHQIRADNLTLTTPDAGTAIQVDGIAQADSDDVVTVKLVADDGASGSNIRFINNASTFNALTAAASGGVDINIGVVTDTGAISVSSDTNNGNAAADDINFNGGSLTAAAGSSVVLDANRSDIQQQSGAGTLITSDTSVTLTANRGIGTSANALEIDTPTVSATNQDDTTDALGDINLDVTNSGAGVAVTADQQGDNAGEDVFVTSSTDTVTLTDIDATKGDVDVDVTGGFGILVGDVDVNTTDGDVNLNSDSTIEDAVAANDTADITAFTLTLESDDGIGVTSSLDLDLTAAGTLTSANNSSALLGGGTAINLDFVETTGNTSVTSITATSGDIDIDSFDSTAAGTISFATVTASSGNLTIDTTAANVTNAAGTAQVDDGSTIAITLAGAGATFTNNAAVNSNSTGLTGTSTITVTADNMALNSGTINSGSEPTTLAPNAANRGMDLGTESGGAVDLVDAELDTVTASVLRIGSGTTGSITISQDVDLTAANVDTVHLIKGATGTITDSSGITVDNLAITSAGGDVILDGDNEVENLAADINGTGDLQFNDTDGFTVSSAAIDGVSNIDTNKGDVHLSAKGLITVTGTVTASSAPDTGHILIATNTSGNVALGANVTAAGDTIAIDSVDQITRTGGTLTATNAMLKAVNGIGASGSSIQTEVTNLAAQVTTGGTEGIYVNDATDVTITTVASVTAVSTATPTFSGVATQGGAKPIEVTTTDGSITVDQPVAADGSGSVTLTANGTTRDITINDTTGDVSSGTGNITMTSTDDIFVDDSVSTTGGAISFFTGTADDDEFANSATGTVGSSGGIIIVNANEMSIGAAINSGAGNIILRSRTDQTFNIGSANANDGTVGLVTGEFTNLTTTGSGTLTVGADTDVSGAGTSIITGDTAGSTVNTPIVVTAATTIPTTVINATLLSSTTITNTGAAFILTHDGSGGTLALDAETGISGLTGTGGTKFGVDAENLAARTRSNGTGILIHETDNVIVSASAGRSTNFVGIATDAGSDDSITLEIDSVNGAGDNNLLTINDPIAADGSGDVTIDANFDAITQQTDNSGTISSTSGNITITWGEDDSTTVSSGQPFNMAAILTNQTGSGGDVNLNYTDDAVDKNLGLLNIKADTLTLNDSSNNAAGDPFALFGAGGDLLELDINALTTTGGQVGQLEISNQGDLSIGPLETTTGGVKVTLFNGGSLTIAGDILVEDDFDFVATADDFEISNLITTQQSAADNGLGDITLQPFSANREINLGHTAGSPPGGMDFSAAELLRLRSQLNTGAGTSDATVTIGNQTSGDITVGPDAINFATSDGSEGTRNYNLTLNGDDLAVGALLTLQDNRTLELNLSGALTSTAATDFAFTTPGAALADDDGNLDIDAVGGVGALGAEIDIIVGAGASTSTLDLVVLNNDATGTSGIFIDSDARTDLNGITNADQGNIDIEALSPLDINADVTGDASGDISLTADDDDAAAGDDITFTGAFAVHTDAGDITLTAGDDIDFVTGAIITSTGGSITLTAGNEGTSSDDDEIGSITMVGTAQIISQGGDITLTAGPDDADGDSDSSAGSTGGDIALTLVNAGTGNVTIRANSFDAAGGAPVGNITDVDAATGVDVIGATVDLDTRGDLGATGTDASIEVDATSLSADVDSAGSGGVYINALGSGGMSVTSISAFGAGNDIELRADEDVTITANNAITAEAASITIDLDSSLISTVAADSVVDIVMTGGAGEVISITTSDSIGSAAIPIDLSTGDDGDISLTAETGSLFVDILADEGITDEDIDIINIDAGIQAIITAQDVVAAGAAPGLDLEIAGDIDAPIASITTVDANDDVEITVSSAIDNSLGRLTITTVDGDVTIAESITSLGDLTLASAGAGEDFTVTGTRTFTSTTGSVSVSSGDDIFFDEMTIIAAGDVTIDPAATTDKFEIDGLTITSSSGSVTIDGAIDNAVADSDADLTITAKGGTVTLSAKVGFGGGDELNEVAITAAAISLGGNIETENDGASAGDITLTADQITLTAQVDLDTEGGDDEQAGAVTISGPVDGGFAFSIDTGGTDGGAINVDSIGQTTAVTSFTADTDAGGADGSLTLNGDVRTSGDITLTLAQTINLGSAVTMESQDGSIDLSSGNEVLNGNGFPLTVLADLDNTGADAEDEDLTVKTTITAPIVVLTNEGATGSGAEVVIDTDPDNTEGSITINGDARFANNDDMTARDDIFFNDLVDVGTGKVEVTSTLGNVTFDGAVNATTDNTTADLIVTASQGTVAFNSTVGATDQGNDLTVSASQIRLGGSITTEQTAGGDDGDVTLSADIGITLDADVTITSFDDADEISGEVLLRGPINGDNSGTARDLVITTDADTDSTITIEDPVGASIDLDNVSFDAGSSTVAVDAITAADVDFLEATGAGGFTLNGDIITISGTTGGIDFNDSASDITLAANVTWSSTDGNIFADNADNDIDSEAGEAYTLTIVTSDGDIALDAVGQNVPLAGLIIQAPEAGSSDVDLNDSITTLNGGIDLSQVADLDINAAMTFSSTGGDIVISGANVDMDGAVTAASVTGNIFFTGTDIDETGSDADLTLRTTGGGDIHLGSASGTVAVGGLVVELDDADGGTFFLAGTIAPAAAGGTGTGIDLDEAENIVLTANTTLDSDATTDGPIALAGTTVTGPAFTLAFDAGTDATGITLGNVNVGTLTLTDAENLALGGVVTVQGTDISTKGLFDGDTIDLSADTTIITNGGNISLGGENINGAFDLVVDAGTGTVDLSAEDIGNSVSLTGLDIRAGFVLNGGTISTAGAASTAGGAVSIVTTVGAIETGTITTDGGAAAAQDGFAAGAITLDAATSLDTGALSADGSAGVETGALSSDGGAGGAVTLTAGTTVGAGGAFSISATGDDGDLNAGGGAGDGGAGGAVTINAGSNITLSTVDSTGGTGDGTGGGTDGGAGGDVRIVSSGGNIVATTLTLTGGGLTAGDDAGAGGDLVVTAGGGTIAITTATTAGGNSAIDDGGDGGTLNISSLGGLTLKGATLTSIGGTGVAATDAGDGGAITVSGPVTLTADTTLETRGGAANGAVADGAVSLSGTVDGTGAGTDDLIINADDASVTLGNLGQTVSLAAVTVAAGTAATAVTNLQGDITAKGAIGLNRDGIQLQDNVEIVSTASTISLNDLTGNGNALVLNSSGTTSVDSLSGLGSLEIDAGGTMTFAEAVTTLGDIDVTTTSDADIVLTTTDGDLTTLGNIRLTAQGAITQNTGAVIDASSGVVRLTANSDNGGDAGDDVDAGAQILGTAVFLDSGANAKVEINIIVDPNNTVGSIRTDGEVFFADDIDMTAQTDIFFDETVDVGVGTTTVTSTVGNVTFDGAVNATTDDTAADLTVSSAQGTVAFNSTVGATRQGNDLSVSAGQIRLGGSITTQDAAGADDGDVTLSADSGIVLDANVTITSFGAADEDSGEVLLRGPVNGDNSGTVRDLVITTDATTDSTITIEDPVGANIGLDKVSFDAGGSTVTVDAITAVDVDFLEATGGITLSGDIATTTKGIDFDNSASAITISGDVTLSSTTGAIDADNAGNDISGASAGNDNLTITSTSGTISLDRVGATALRSFTVASSGTTTLNDDITTEGGGIDLSAAEDVNLATAAPLTMSATSGDILLTGGAVDGNISLTVETTVGGNVDLGPLGQGTPLGGLDVDLTGGTLTLRGDISTKGAGTGIALDDAETIALAANVTLDSTAGADGAITVGPVSGPNSLTITSLTAAATVSDADIESLTVNDGGARTVAGVINTTDATSITGDSITFNADTGITAGDTVTIDANDGTITFPATAFITATNKASLSAADTGVALTLTVAGNVTSLQGNVAVDIDQNGANNGTLDVTGNLTAAQTITVTLDEAAGGNAEMDLDGELNAPTVTIRSSETGAGTNLIELASSNNRGGFGITVYEGTGTANGTLTVDGAVAAAGSVTAAIVQTVNINSTITTTSSGDVSITASTALTTAAAGDITADGEIDFLGAGTKNLSGDLIAIEDVDVNNVAIIDATMAATSEIGDLTLAGASARAGTVDVTLEARQGTVTTGTFDAAAGFVVRTLTITAADIALGPTSTGTGGLNVTGDGNTATVEADQSSTGNIVFNDSIILDDATASVTIKTTANDADITIAGRVNDTAAGSDTAFILSVNGDGSIILGDSIGTSVPPASLTITQAGTTGSTTLNGTIIVDGAAGINLSAAENVLLGSDVTLRATDAAADIDLDLVNGPFTLTGIAGNDINVTQAIGGNTALTGRRPMTWISTPISRPPGWPALSPRARTVTWNCPTL